MPRNDDFKALMLDKMPPGASHSIPHGVFDLRYFRARVSAVNRAEGTNIKVHVNQLDRSIEIWHDPNPRPVPSMPLATNPLNSLERLSALRRQYEACKTAIPLRSDELEKMGLVKEMGRISEQIDALVIEVRAMPQAQTRKRGGAIHQPLDVVLTYLHLHKDEWNKLDPITQRRMKIGAEIEIRDKQRGIG